MTRPAAVRHPGRGFYRRPTLDVARDLLGLVLVHEAPAGRTSGIIVEVEAYIGEDDPACHASAGRTARNDPMYGDAGFAYVYLNYGIHHLLNVVTEPVGVPAAVLLRALEPLDGIDVMRGRRGSRRDGGAIAVHDLCRGPGNLTRAMGVGPRHNRADLLRNNHSRSDCASASSVPCNNQSRTGCGARTDAGRLWIEDRGVVIRDVVWTPRIGIRLGLEREWRVVVAGHPSVSGKAAR